MFLCFHIHLCVFWVVAFMCIGRGVCFFSLLWVSWELSQSPVHFMDFNNDVFSLPSQDFKASYSEHECLCSVKAKSSLLMNPTPVFGHWVCSAAVIQHFVLSHARHMAARWYCGFFFQHPCPRRQYSLLWKHIVKSDGPLGVQFFVYPWNYRIVFPLHCCLSIILLKRLASYMTLGIFFHEHTAPCLALVTLGPTSPLSPQSLFKIPWLQIFFLMLKLWRVEV